MQVRAEEPVEKEVAVGAGWLLAPECEVALQPGCGRRGGGLPGVVGLRRASGDHAVGARFERGADQVLELADLVAAGRQSGEIVSLDPEFDPEFVAEPPQRLQGSGPEPEFEAGGLHAQRTSVTLR